MFIHGLRLSAVLPECECPRVSFPVLCIPFLLLNFPYLDCVPAKDAWGRNAYPSNFSTEAEILRLNIGKKEEHSKPLSQASRGWKRLSWIKDQVAWIETTLPFSTDSMERPPWLYPLFLCGLALVCLLEIVRRPYSLRMSLH